MTLELELNIDVHTKAANSALDFFSVIGGLTVFLAFLASILVKLLTMNKKQNYLVGKLYQRPPGMHKVRN